MMMMVSHDVYSLSGLARPVNQIRGSSLVINRSDFTYTPKRTSIGIRLPSSTVPLTQSLHRWNANALENRAPGRVTQCL